MDGMYIADGIRRLRKAAGMNVDEVGEAVGRSGKTVSAWETGRNVPSADMLIDICRLFDVDIDYFYPPEVSRYRYAVVDMRESQPEALTAEEMELLDSFRSLDDRGRQAALYAVRGIAAAHRQSGDAQNTVAG